MIQDISGRDIQIGDFIVYTEGGINAPDLVFGWVERMNPLTDKIWVKPGTWDRQVKMKRVYDRQNNQWVSGGQPCNTTLINYTQTNRFMIL